MESAAQTEYGGALELFVIAAKTKNGRSRGGRWHYETLQSRPTTMSNRREDGRGGQYRNAESMKSPSITVTMMIMMMIVVLLLQAVAMVKIMTRIIIIICMTV